MADIKVNTQKLRDTASQLNTMNSRLRNEESTMRQQQRTLTSQWDGPSNDVFDQAFNRNVNEFANFITLITDYANALNKYADDYERMERANQQIASTR